MQSINETRNRLPGQILEGVDEGHHKAVEVRPGDVLQVAAGDDAGGEGLLHRSQIGVQGLPGTATTTSTEQSTTPHMHGSLFL